MTPTDPPPAARTRRGLRALLATLAVVTVTVGLPAPAAVADASAGTTVTWGVRPGDGEPHDAGRANFAYAVAPGSVVEDSLVVTNHGDHETTLQVYAADAFTTAQGALDLRRTDERSTGVGAWTVVGTREVVVPAGRSVEVPFTLTVPADAEPGDHAGGVVTSLLSTRADGVGVDRRLGARVHLRVDGDVVPAAGLGAGAVFDPRGLGLSGTVDVEVDVVNTGNARLAGPVAVTVAGPFGWGEREARLDVPELLPGERATVVVPVDGVAALGVLTAHVRYAPDVVVDGTTLTAVTASVSTPAVPWTALGAVLLAAMLVVAARVRTRRREAATERRIAAALADVAPVVSGPGMSGSGASGSGASGPEVSEPGRHATAPTG